MLSEECKEENTCIVFKIEENKTLRTLDYEFPSREFVLNQEPTEELIFENLTFSKDQPHQITPDLDISTHSCYFKLSFKNHLHIASDDYGYEVILRALVNNSKEEDPEHVFIVAKTEMRVVDAMVFRLDYLTKSTQNNQKLLHVCFSIRRFKKSTADDVHESSPRYEIGQLLLNQKFYSDVSLNVGGTSIRAHKYILSLKSNVFKKMFDQETPEEKCEIVEINDLDVEVVNAILSYIYTGKIKGFGRLLLELLNAAIIYEIDDLVAKCEEYCLFNMDNDDAVAISKLTNSLN